MRNHIDELQFRIFCSKGSSTSSQDFQDIGDVNITSSSWRVFNTCSIGVVYRFSNEPSMVVRESINQSLITNVTNNLSDSNFHYELSSDSYTHIGGMWNGGSKLIFDGYMFPLFTFYRYPEGGDKNEGNSNQEKLLLGLLILLFYQK